jgi:hypothetical protein
LLFTPTEVSIVRAPGTSRCLVSTMVSG